MDVRFGVCGKVYARCAVLRMKVCFSFLLRKALLCIEIHYKHFELRDFSINSRHYLYINHVLYCTSTSTKPLIPFPSADAASLVALSLVDKEMLAL